MFVSFIGDIGIHLVKLAKDAAPVIEFRSADPLIVGQDGEDGEAVKPLDSGVYAKRLTERQTTAFHALDSVTLSTMFEAGRIDLPDAKRGRVASLGVSLASLIAARAEAEAEAADAAENAEDGTEDGASDAPENAEDAPEDAPAPKTRKTRK